MPDRELVRERFSRAAPGYDAGAGLQEDVALRLMGLLDRAPSHGPWTRGGHAHGPLRVLDAGCGTGRLMGKVRERMRGVPVFGLDMAFPMLREAAMRPGLHVGAPGLVGGLCEALPFIEGSFGLVVANLAYQWVRDLEGAFREVARVLLPHGLFAFSTLGPRTLHELRSSLARADGGRGRFSLTPFADMDEVEGALEASGLGPVLIEKKTMTRAYEDPLCLLRALEKTGASARGRISGRGLSRGTFLKKALRIYEKRYPLSRAGAGGAAGAGVRATYEVILVLAGKREQ